MEVHYFLSSKQKNPIRAIPLHANESDQAVLAIQPGHVSGGLPGLHP
jgi:hypothetical protein